MIIQPYLHSIHAWTKSNNTILNSDKTTCTLFTIDPAEYNTKLNLQNQNTQTASTTTYTPHTSKHTKTSHLRTSNKHETHTHSLCIPGWLT